MKVRWPVMFGFVACAAPLAAIAQTFPHDAVPPSDEELRLRITGKTFHATLSGGGRWEVNYRPGGGFTGKTKYQPGKEDDDEAGWTTQNGKLCRVDLEGATVCNEVRVQGSDLYLQRDDGTVVKVEPD